MHTITNLQSIFADETFSTRLAGVRTVASVEAQVTDKTVLDVETAFAVLTFVRSYARMLQLMFLKVRLVLEGFTASLANLKNISKHAKQRYYACYRNQ